MTQFSTTPFRRRAYRTCAEQVATQCPARDLTVTCGNYWDLNQAGVPPVATLCLNGTPPPPFGPRYSLVYIPTHPWAVSRPADPDAARAAREALEQADVPFPEFDNLLRPVGSMTRKRARALAREAVTAFPTYKVVVTRAAGAESLIHPAFAAIWTEPDATREDVIRAWKPVTRHELADLVRLIRMIHASHGQVAVASYGSSDTVTLQHHAEKDWGVQTIHRRERIQRFGGRQVVEAALASNGRGFTVKRLLPNSLHEVAPWHLVEHQYGAPATLDASPAHGFSAALDAERPSAAAKLAHDDGAWKLEGRTFAEVERWYLAHKRELDALRLAATAKFRAERRPEDWVVVE